MDIRLVLVLVPLFSAGAGAYLGAYLRKKGENLATHEDIERLLDQVRKVTTTTEQIKAEISSDVWDRQRQWELKREMIIEVSKAISDVEEGLLTLGSVTRVMKSDDDEWKQPFYDATQKWRKASATFDTARFLVTIVCNKEAANAVHEYGKFATQMAADLTRTKDAKVYDDRGKDLGLRYEQARRALRSELGFKDPTPQSSVSSATPRTG